MASIAFKDEARAYLEQIQRVPLLTREEEERLAKAWNEKEDSDAARKLVEANLRFVVKVALGYRHYGIPFNDLVQEGNLGLMKAVQNFDSGRGTRLITYAVWWIKAYIQASVLRSWSMVRIGTTQTQRRLFYRLNKADEELRRAGLPESERVKQLSHDLMAREEEVRNMLSRLKARDLALDAPVTDEEGPARHMDFLQDPRPDPEGEAGRSSATVHRQHLITRALDGLSDRERFIVEHRFLGEERRTLRELGVELGVSRERVRQLEAQALRKMRRLLGDLSDLLD
jgi:RNA polymerase sigma-32 factor